MNDQPDYSAGGFIPGDSVRVTLHPDECVIRPTTWECARPDHEHDPREAEQRRARVAMALEHFRDKHDEGEQRE